MRACDALLLLLPLLAVAAAVTAPRHDERHGALSAATDDCPRVVDDLAERPFGRGMADMVPLLARLATRRPLAYAHFNDGEARAAAGSTGTCCQIRTDPESGQPLSPRLRDLMREAIGTNADGFLVGLPCEREFSSMKAHLQQFLPPTHAPRRSLPTSSTILINANYVVAHELLPAILERRRPRLHLLVSDAANTTRFAEATGIVPASTLRLPLHAGFPGGYDAHRDAWKRFQPGDVAVLCAGPVGRLLAPHWFRHAPNVTVLELGSFFDPELGQPAALGAPYQMNPDKWKPSCEFEGDQRAELTAGERACLLEVAATPRRRASRAPAANVVE